MSMDTLEHIGTTPCLKRSGATSPEWHPIDTNWIHPPFADPKHTRAMAEAIGRESMRMELGLGMKRMPSNPQVQTDADNP